MAMLRVCGHPGCGTLTLGELCVEHEALPPPGAARTVTPWPGRSVPAVAVVSRTRRVIETDKHRPRD